MKKLAFILLLFTLVVNGCLATSGRSEDSKIPARQEDKNRKPVTLPAEEPTTTERPKDEEIFALLPNEAGQVMVLMYHEIGATEATWRRTAENFRADMELLYSEGYRPVALNDFIEGKIDLAAGMTPFVLTFDDASAGQFRFLEKSGERILDPDSAVAILLEMGDKYDDFTPAATFFVYYPVPFRQHEFIQEKMLLLQQWGFEIGNHGYNHENLAKTGVAAAVEALAKNVQATQKYLPGYQVKSLALPYGARPENDSHLISGTWENISYQHEAILLVGANPAPSPFSNKFNPYKLPRVRADKTELSRWLEYFRLHPDQKYISDGSIDMITVPEIQSKNLSTDRVNSRQVRVYDPALY